MQDEVAIKVESLTKIFHEQAGAKSFKEIFVGIGRKLAGKKEKTLKNKGNFTALKDISFDVKKGEFFGIVGRNGCGKSTLLKLLAGVYTPTKGEIGINGKLTPFIELGVGFNPELSGRDNVFLNGALLGFTRKQMQNMYKDIVDFAELADFMDVKLKNYSSGMQVRLAFSVAIRAESDILLIDEVLAVGDAAFQQKCFNYFDNLKRNKKTIVFVTHSMASVRQYCDRALYIDNGSLLKISNPNEISDIYEEKNLNIDQHNDLENDRNHDNNFKTIVLNSKKVKADAIKYAEDFYINIAWSKNFYPDIVKNIGVIIYRGSEPVFATNTVGRIDCSKIDNISLKVNNLIGNGRYRLFIGLFGESMTEEIVSDPNAANYTSYGAVRVGRVGDEWDGIVYLDNNWATNVKL